MEKLREYKFTIGDMNLAYADVGATIFGGYMLVKYMKWDVKKTIPATFFAGYIIHEMVGVSTPLNDKINETFAPRPIDGIPINNSLKPVGLTETRDSTL